MELFDLPPQRKLGAEVHAAVFGELPASLAGSLKTGEVAEVVLRLLDAGWRTGQLASRVGALPAGPDPAAEVLALLRGFVGQIPPDQRWQAERAARDAARSNARFEEPASDASRERWIAQIRTELGGPRRARPAASKRVRPACALCGAESHYFVTREVRLCSACVALLGSGTASLSEAG